MSGRGSLHQVLKGVKDWCVINASCIQVLERIRLNEVGHVITDAPYSDHVHRNMRGNRGRNIVGEKKIVVREAGFKPITEEEIHLVVEHFTRIASKWILACTDDFTLRYWQDAGDLFGKYYRTIPWTRWSSPNFSGMSPPSGAEFIACIKGKHKGNVKWLHGGRTHYDTKCLRAKQFEKVKTLDYGCTDLEHAGHRAQKPEELMCEVISDCSLPGDIILDPYAGYGTTGVAALKLGRRVILVDEDSECAEVCANRLADTERKIRKWNTKFLLTKL